MKLSELTQGKTTTNDVSGGISSRDKSILRQVAFKGAVEMYRKGVEWKLSELLNTAEEFEAWLNRPL